MKHYLYFCKEEIEAQKSSPFAQCLMATEWWRQNSNPGLPISGSSSRISQQVTFLAFWARWIFLCQRGLAAPCDAGCLAASLTSVYQMPVAKPPLSHQNEKCLQILPNVPWKTNSHTFTESTPPILSPFQASIQGNRNYIHLQYMAILIYEVINFS